MTNSYGLVCAMVATAIRATYAGSPYSLAYSYQGKNTTTSARSGKVALASAA